MSDTNPDTRTCDFCHEPVSKKSMKRHVARKHADGVVLAQESEQPADEHTVTGVFLANGETYTGTVIELTAQDFKRGSFDYYLIKTSDGDKLVVQTERAA